MNRISLYVTALAGATGLALLAGPAPAQPSSGPDDWSGAYVGLNGGWNDTQSHSASSTVTTNQLTGVSAGGGAVTVPPTTSVFPGRGYSNSSWAGGGQVGFNKQMGQVVVGLEGDMDAVGGRAHSVSSNTLPATGLTSGSAVTVDRFTEPNWTSTVRGRLGWATGPVLLYGTGGLAIADVRQSARYGYAPTVTGAVTAANPGATFGPFSNTSSDDRTLTGWTVGAGAEFALNRSVSIGAEYRHADFGGANYNLGANAANSSWESARLGLKDDQVLAKVNFRFGNGLF
jgi:outer membrane immunogenic protein